MRRPSKATTIGERRSPPTAPQYRFVGGKGGVGKTTCAAALGLQCADRGIRTLLISIDPAPSLGDAFGRRLGQRPTSVDGPLLHAVEMDARVALDRWLAGRRRTLEEIAYRGTWLDHDDVSRLLRLSLPGMDELAALLQVAELAMSRRYERIIVDTAPTGHLLRMLEMPTVLHGVSAVFDRMQAKHRIMVNALRGGWAPDAADVLIDQLREDAERLMSLLRDPARVRTSWVTLPERMSVEEAADAVTTLRKRGMTVDTILVNQVTTPSQRPCRWCAARRRVEARAAAELRRWAGASARIISVPAVEREPRGTGALRRIGELIARSSPPRFTTSGRTSSAMTASLPAGARFRGAGHLVGPGTRLLMFGGKGGVGKTTCAAAAALALARQSPSARLLLLSTDPAHSLGDVLGEVFTDVPIALRGGPGNLLVREINPERVYGDLRARFGRAIDEMFAGTAAAGSVERSLAAADRQLIADLLDLAPPGIDEIAAILEVTEAVVERQDGSTYDLVVVDTAPSGHALRLIEMPSLIHDWVKTVMAILLKYQPVSGLGALASVLLQLARGIRRLRELMSDPGKTRFIAVTRPAALPRAETLRLLARLRASRVAVPFVVVNAVGAGTCARCRRLAVVQTREVGALRRQLTSSVRGAAPLILAPAAIPPPHGAHRLTAWLGTWREVSAAPGPRVRRL